MSQDSIRFRLFGQIRQSADRKIGILVGKAELNVTEGIAQLTEGQKRELQTNLERWVDGHDGPKGRFHNFVNDSIAPMAFVFKSWDHRFYGYKVNPSPKTAPNMQLIVLCSHAIKPGPNTDPAQKRFIKKMAGSSGAKTALTLTFDDTPKDTKKGPLKWQM